MKIITALGILFFYVAGPAQLYLSQSRDIPGHTEAVHFLWLSSDKKRAVSAGDSELFFWDFAGGQKEKNYELNGPVAVSGDFSRFAKADSEGVDILNAKTFEVEKRIKNSSDLGFSATDSFYALAFSKDAKRLAIAGLGDLLVIYNVADGGKRPIRLKHGPIDSLCFSPDGNLLAVAHADGNVCIWSAESGELLKDIEAFTKSASCISFSQDGKLLAAGSEDTSIKLWHVSDWTLSKTLSHKGIVFSLAFSPDGKHIATAANAGKEKTSLEIFETQSGKSVANLPQLDFWLFCLAFTPEGNGLAAGCDDSHIRVWTISTSPQ